MLRHHHVGALFCKAPNSPLSSLRRRRWVLLCNTSLTFPRSSRRDPSVHNKMALWGFGKKDKKPTASLQTRGRPWLNSRSRGARLWDDVTDSREITTPPTCRAHNWAVGMGSSGGGVLGGGGGVEPCRAAERRGRPRLCQLQAAAVAAQR